MTEATNIADTSDFDEFQDELKPGTQLLQGQYTIDKYLNSGGFAITYLARDSLDRQVVIKECFPGSFCRRSQALVQARSRAHQSEYKAIVKLFIQEARGLAKLNHPNIVGVHQVFEDNSTAYMALDLIKGRDLLDTLEDETGQLKPNQIAAILKKILGAIKYMHDQNVLHRDISPDNILLNEELEPILIDFGAAREQASKVGKVLSALRVVKDGYSPQEFYVSGSIQGPSSDLYALGATFYHLITGEIPPDSQIRLASAAAREPDPYKPLHGNIKGFDDIFLMAIDKSLRLMPKDRIQSAGEWLAKIDEKEAAKASSAEDDVTATVAQIMQQPGVVAPPPPKAKPEPAAAAPQPVKAARSKAKPTVNRLDEIANEMASEEAEKKKIAGKMFAGVAVAAVLAGAVIYTQTDLFTGPSGNDAVSGDTEVNSTSIPPQPTETASSQTGAAVSEQQAIDSAVASVIEPVQVAPETANTDVVIAEVTPSETAIVPEVLPEVLPEVSPVPETNGTAEASATKAPTGSDQSLSVAKVAETTPEPEAPAKLTSFTPVDLTDAEVGLNQPQITEITEVSLVLPRNEGPINTDAAQALSVPSDPVVADAVSFALEASGVAPVYSTDIEQPLPEPTPDASGLPLSEGSAFTPPKTAQPVVDFASLASLDAMTPEAGPKILTTPIALSSLIVPATYLTTNWTAQLPFDADESDGVTITRVKAGAEPWMTAGQTITTINGQPVDKLGDISRILEATIANSDEATIPVNFGIQDATGAVDNHDTVLKLLGKSVLKDGTTFETAYEQGVWKTTVAAVSETSADEFVVGDIVIANVEAKEKIEGRNTLADILNQGFSTGEDNLRFIVDRNGSNWFATIRVSQVGGFQKSSLKSSNSGE